MNLNNTDNNLTKTESSGAAFIYLLAFAALTIILWQVPFGKYIMWPFTILGVWFHEMGHGITAIFLGGSLHSLELLPDGSGLAKFSGVEFLGGIGKAMVAAGGPLGPSIAGALLIGLSRNQKFSGVLLFLLGSVLLLSAILWIRTLFGFIFIFIIGLAILFLSIKGKPGLKTVLVRLLGVQACVSVFLSIDYMFSAGGIIGGNEYISDTAVMERELWLPYWFWGGLLLVISVIMIVLSLTIAYSKKKVVKIAD